MANSPENGGPGEEQPFKSSYAELFSLDASGSQSDTSENAAELDHATEAAGSAQESSEDEYLPYTSDGEIDWDRIQLPLYTFTDEEMFGEPLWDSPSKTSEDTFEPEPEQPPEA